MTNLRSKLIRLARSNPPLRGDLLPLITAATKKTVRGDDIRQGFYTMVEGVGKLTEAVRGDLATYNDPRLKKALKDLQDAQKAVMEALGPYDWD